MKNYNTLIGDVSYDRFVTISKKLIDAIFECEDIEQIKFYMTRYESVRRTLDEILEKKEKNNG